MRLYLLPEYNRFNKGLYEWIGFKEKVIPYKNEIRKAGKSKFGFKKSMNYAIQGIISFNDRPLRVCIQFGFICLGLAILYLAFEMMKYMFAQGNYVSGYFTTIAAIILFSGVQLNIYRYSWGIHWKNLLRSEAPSSFHY